MRSSRRCVTSYAVQLVRAFHRKSGMVLYACGSLITLLPSSSADQGSDQDAAVMDLCIGLRTNVMIARSPRAMYQAEHPR